MNLDFTKVLFESIQCGIIVVDVETNKVIYVNDSACNILQIDNTIVGSECGKVLCLESEECQFKTNPNNEVKKDEICIITKTQKKKWLLRNANKIQYNGNQYIIESFTDITSQKITEQNYYDLVRYAPAGIYELDLKTFEFTTLNQLMLQYTGYTEEELKAVGILGLLSKSSQQLFFERMQKITNGEQVEQEVEYEVEAKNGKFFYVLLNARYIYNGDKIPYKAFCVVTDITKRKMAEFKLIEEKCKAQMYLDMAFDIFITLDIQGNITLINKTGCDILNGNEKDLLGLNWFDTFVPVEDQDGAKSEFFETITGTNGDKEQRWQNFITTLTGEKRYIQWKNKPIRDISGNIVGTFSAGDDITDQYKKEKQMIKIWDNTQIEMKQKPPSISILRKKTKCPQLDCLDKAYQLVSTVG